MPQFPKPFFRPARRLWYVQIDGKQINLGPEKKPAFDHYHKLMRGRLRGTHDEHVIAILEAFLEWSQQNNAPKTYEWYQRHIQAFVRFIPAELRVSQLTPNHLTQLFAKHPRWSSTTRNAACRAVQRAFNWAEEQRLIERSPIAKMKKPKCKTREVVIMPAEFDHFLELPWWVSIIAQLPECQRAQGVSIQAPKSRRCQKALLSKDLSWRAMQVTHQANSSRVRISRNCSSSPGRPVPDRKKSLASRLGMSIW